MTGTNSHTRSGLLALTFAALGVVYGDIATSPLYAINEIFFGSAGVTRSKDNVVGVISLAVWALIIIICTKYLLFVLRADNDGQGGVYALYGIVRRYRKRKIEKFLMVLLLLSAGMLFGDGIITPAISVLAAVEGLAVAQPEFAHYVVPITIGILFALFSIQRFGTSNIGTIFGPIVIVWLVSIALLGILQVRSQPAILYAFNPVNGLEFISSTAGYKTLLVLGSVILVIIGGEALYADMGHFGKAPIQLGWFSIVFPCLICNYLGQGAYLLSGKAVAGGNIFYSLVPQWGLYPMIILATLATIIASQALISGAFSLTMQAVGLELFPRMHKIHTHKDHHGQIYIPFTNWALCVGAILLVLTFGSSSRLASAYGLAVSADMLTTSLAMIVIAIRVWKWSPVFGFGLFGVFALVDSGFLFANTLKFLQGGFVPLSLGFGLAFVMRAWSWGRHETSRAYESHETGSLADLISLKARDANHLPKTIIFMTPKPLLRATDNLPSMWQVFYDRLGIIPHTLVFLDVHHKAVPYIHGERCSVRSLYDDPEKGKICSITVTFGFMEDPDVEKALEELRATAVIPLPEDPHEWNIYASQERLIPAKNISLTRSLLLRAFLLLRTNSLPAYYFYGLARDAKLSLEIYPVRVS